MNFPPGSFLLNCDKYNEASFEVTIYLDRSFRSEIRKEYSLEKTEFKWRYFAGKIWACIPCRVLSLIVAVFLGLLLSSELIINPVLNYIVKPKLIENANDKIYHLNIEHLRYDLLTNSLSGINISYTWNDTSAGSIDSSVILIPRSRAKGISLFGLLFRSRLNVMEVHLFSPEFKIFSLEQNENRKINGAEKNNIKVSPVYRSIYRSIPDRIKPFKIRKVEITGGSYKKIDKRKNILLHSLSSVDAGVKDFSIQSLERNDSLELMFCSEINLNFGESNFFYPKKKYRLNIKSIKFSSSDSLLTVNSFSFHSLLPDAEFFKGDIYRQDRWKVSIPEFTCAGINLSNLIWYNAVDIKTVSLKAEYIDILTNKKLPMEPGVIPEMPNEIISKAPIGLNIRRIDLNIDSMIVRESWPYSKNFSRLPFTKIKGEISNLSNMKELQNYNSPAVINASGHIAGAGLLTLNLRVPLLSKGNDFKYSGSLTKMDAAALNSHMVISDLVRISSGTIDSASFHAEAKNSIVTADIIPYYRNLKIKTINESMDSTGLLNSIKSFVANVFSVKNDNTANPGELRKGHIIYTAKRTDTFLDIIWAALKTALGEVVGF